MRQTEIFDTKLGQTVIYSITSKKELHHQIKITNHRNRNTNNKSVEIPTKKEYEKRVNKDVL